MVLRLRFPRRLTETQKLVLAQVNEAGGHGRVYLARHERTIVSLGKRGLVRWDRNPFTRAFTVYSTEKGRT